MGLPGFSKVSRQGVAARNVNRCRQDRWFAGVRERREGTQIAGEQSGWGFRPELFTRASGLKAPVLSTHPHRPACSDAHMTMVI